MGKRKSVEPKEETKEAPMPPKKRGGLAIVVVLVAIAVGVFATADDLKKLIFDDKKAETFSKATFATKPVEAPVEEKPAVEELETVEPDAEPAEEVKKPPVAPPAPKSLSGHVLYQAREFILQDQFTEAVDVLNASLVGEARQRHIEDETLRVIHEAYSGLAERMKGQRPKRKPILRGIGGLTCKAIKGTFGAGATDGRYAIGYDSGDVRGSLGHGVTVWSHAPLIATIDDWLTPTEMSYIPGVIQAGEDAKTTAAKPRAVPLKKDMTEEEKKDLVEPALCLSTRRRLELQKRIKHIATKHAEAPEDAFGWCPATAALLDEDPFPFDGEGRVCSPITVGLDNAMIGSDTIIFDVGSDAKIDALDAAISRAVGFDDEYDAYDMSTHSQITTYRPNKGFDVHIDCHDFAFMASTERAVTAIMYLGDEGQTYFPVLDLAIKAKTGRLLIFENLLPDSTCDPSTAHTSTPLKDGETKAILQKWFYVDRTFDRKAQNAEGMEERPTGYADCDLNDCRRYERLPTVDGGATIERMRYDRTNRTKIHKMRPPRLVCDYSTEWGEPDVFPEIQQN